MTTTTELTINHVAIIAGNASRVVGVYRRLPASVKSSLPHELREQLEALKRRVDNWCDEPNRP